LTQRWRRNRGVAGETIYRYRCVDMTGLAELVLRINGNKLAFRIFAGMTVDAAGETVSDRANPLMHGLVTVVVHEIKMIPAHDIHRLNALFPTGWRNLGLDHVCVHCGRRPRDNASQ